MGQAVDNRQRMPGSGFAATPQVSDDPAGPLVIPAADGIGGYGRLQAPVRQGKIGDSDARFWSGFTILVVSWHLF